MLVIIGAFFCIEVKRSLGLPVSFILMSASISLIIMRASATSEQLLLFNMCISKSTGNMETREFVLNTLEPLLPQGYLLIFLVLQGIFLFNPSTFQLVNRNRKLRCFFHSSDNKDQLNMLI